MLMVPTVLNYSEIHGLGVFAAAPIKKGQLIWQLNENFERILSPEDVAAHPDFFADFVKMYCYPYSKKEGYVILEVDNGRFMNHSPTPNTDFSGPDKGYALRDIAEGEELICNYSEFDPGFELLP